VAFLLDTPITQNARTAYLALPLFLEIFIPKYSFLSTTSLHILLREEEEKMITLGRISLIKSSPLFYNVARRSISSSQLTIEKVQDTVRFDKRPKKENLQFGITLSDHMLMVEWDKTDGWHAPAIVPYQDLKISPAASSLHYGK
jgi:hypothetical protein